MRRTWCGIQFTFDPTDGTWLSKDGIKLHCASALRSPCSDHWSVWSGTYCWSSGMSATEALTRFLKMREEG